MGMAARVGRVEVIPLLLEAGAGVDMPNKVGGGVVGGVQGLSPTLGSMVMTMHPARSRLMAWPFPLSPQQAGFTALISGAEQGHAAVVEMLLAAGADKDLQNNVRDSTTTPLSLSQPVTPEEDECDKALRSHPSLCLLNSKE